jgi:hypothetical protein
VILQRWYCPEHGTIPSYLLYSGSATRRCTSCIRPVSWQAHQEHEPGEAHLRFRPVDPHEIGPAGPVPAWSEA